LAFGLRTGVQNYRFAWEKIDYQNDLEESPNGQSLNDWKLNFDFGIRYSNRLSFLGVSLAHINSPKIDVQLSDTLNYYSRIVRDLTITGGKAFEINEDLVIRPSFMARANRGVGVVDLNCSFLLKQTLWLGFSASTSKRLVLLAEYHINNNLRAGYSFDMSLTPIRKYSYGSHEIFVSFEFGTIPKPAMISPRVYGYF
jgi:type IX secretion system PorP/SprF family membrane protein